MRESIKYLPKYAQDDLRDIRQRVLEGLPHCEMIILFGSYARGTFVSFDERDEFGIRTSFMSDYDIFVLTSHMDPNHIKIYRCSLESRDKDIIVFEGCIFDESFNLRELLKQSNEIPELVLLLYNFLGKLLESNILFIFIQ